MTTTRNITADPQDDNTFIISINGEPVYRTGEMTLEEAEEAEYNTSGDWEAFLTNGSYSKITD